MVAPYRPLIPGDWVRLEQLINEIFAILNQDTTLTNITSDITLTGSDLKLVSDALATETSDRASDIKYLSDALVATSNALSTEISDRKSDIKYLSDALSTEISDRASDIKYLSDTVCQVVSDNKLVSDLLFALSDQVWGYHST